MGEAGRGGQGRQAGGEQATGGRGLVVGEGGQEQEQEEGRVSTSIVGALGMLHHAPPPCLLRASVAAAPSHLTIGGSSLPCHQISARVEPP